jgi:hypothetical protein
MDTLSHVRSVPGVGHEPGKPWVKPWPGPTAWIVTEPDWEHDDIHGVAATIEAAWEIVRALPDCPDGALFWQQDERYGSVFTDRYWIEPHELRGATT